jgi:hypothetical protein
MDDSRPKQFTFQSLLHYSVTNTRKSLDNLRIESTREISNSDSYLISQNKQIPFSLLVRYSESAYIDIRTASVLVTE